MRSGWALKHGWRLRLALGCAALGCAAFAATFAAEARAGIGGGPKFDARGSVKQVYVTGAPARARMQLLDPDGEVLKKKRVNARGGVLFRHVPPGLGYRVRRAGGGKRSGPLRVLPEVSKPRDTDIYNQSIPDEGYGYLTTRDGTKLAIYVHPPEDVTKVVPGLDLPPVPDGPTPTLIEYSGYGYANPAGPESGISIIGNLMGFTVVDVNMRGTGCSGGAFDFFEPLQSLDGYDVVETISRQPWVKHHKVGMMGISYGGISQLFTAATNPPSLAAISPLSVIDQTQTTLYPGGILNTGFAVAWAEDRIDEAKPASPNGGQEWAYERIQEGDKVCKANQALHPEAADLKAKIRANDHYRAKVADPLAPITFVDEIDVPVFMACQWTDEQTGGHCPDLVDRFTGTDRKWFTFTNGTHVDSLAPEAFNRWYDFLQLFVAKRAPITYSALVQAAGPVIYQEAMGIPGVTMPPDPVQQQPTYAAALEEFEKQKPVRILFDNGAGGSEPGQPKPGFERFFSKLPIPGVEGKSWYLGREGKLNGKPPERRHADQFTWDADALPLTNFTGNTAAGEGGLWTATPPYHWKEHPEGTAAAYVTSPLGQDTTVIGAGFVRLWVRSKTPNADLQATITEVRPDGKETFVQGGWVSGKARALDRRKSTPLEPVLSLRKRDFAPMPSDRFVKVTIPLYFQGHAYRAGSRIRVVISAPNGDQPIWSFSETKPKGEEKIAIAFSERKPSRLTLPVVPNVDVPTELPTCPGLRGEPCRDYQPFENR